MAAGFRPIIKRFRRRLNECENKFVNMNLYVMLNQVVEKLLVFLVKNF